MKHDRNLKHSAPDFAATSAVLQPNGQVQQVLTPARADYWLSSASGTWSQAANWSAGVPGAASNVHIDLADPGYSITIDSAAYAHRLIISGASTYINDTASLTVGTSLDIESGSFSIYNGTLTAGIIDVAAGASLGSQGGAINTSLFEGTLVISYGDTTFAAGTRFAGSGGTGTATLLVSADTLTFLGNETLNHVTIDLDTDGAQATLAQAAIAGETLTLGSTATVNFEGQGGTLEGGDLAGDKIINKGTINASGGRVMLDVTGFTNQGVFNLDAGVTLDFTGATTGTSLTALIASLTNEGGTLEFDRLSVTGGTLSGNYGILAAATLTGVAVQGDLSIESGSALTIGAGSTFAGAGGSGVGDLVVGADASLIFAPGAALNNVDVALALVADSYIVTLTTAGTASNAETLTIGANTTITALDGIITAGNTNAADMVVNNGVIDVTGFLGIDWASFENLGSIDIAAGGALALQGQGGGSATFTVAEVTAAMAEINNAGIGVIVDGVISPGTLNANLAGGDQETTTLDDVAFEGTLTIAGYGGGVTFENGTSFAGADGVGQGTINISGSDLTFGDNTALANVVINLTGGGINGRQQAGGTLTIANSVTMTGYGGITTSDGTTILDGTIETSGLGKSFVFNDTEFPNEGSVTNNGTIGAAAGSGLQFIDGPGNFDNNGLISVTSGALQIFRTTLDNETGGTLSLTASAGATTTVYGGTDAFLNNQGDLIIAGGTESIGAVISNSGTISAGSGTIQFIAAVHNQGTLVESGGSASFSAGVVGAGALKMENGGTISLLAGDAATQKLDFLDGTGVLNLGSPASVLGTIAGFSAGDHIDLLNTQETGYSFSNGVLTVTDASTTVASLHFSGSYTTGSFTLQSDTHGGSLITFN